jgi:hypothetical protein
MKFILVIIALVALSASAQTNTVRVFTTNYVAAASNFREVDGQLYDTTRSIKWETIRCKYKKSFGNDAVFVKIERVKIGEREPDRRRNLDNVGLYGSSSPVIIPTTRAILRDEEGNPLLVRNVPAAMLQVDQEYSLRLFLVGSTNEFQLYDLGTPHMVPVVTARTVKTQ